MKLINRIKILLLISIFIALFFGTRSFATTGIITDITVNLREKDSTDSKIISYVTQDDKVEVLEKDGDWYKVKAEGKTGYVFGEYVKVDDSKIATNNETETYGTVEQSDKEKTEMNTTGVKKNLKIKSKVNVRIIPNILSNVIYTTKKDISIDIIEQLSDWTYISVDNITGWIRTDNIVEENVEVEVSNEKDQEEVKVEDNKEVTDTETKNAYIKYDTVNLRKEASTSATVLAKLKLNDEVKIISKVDNVWSKVEVDGITGYISSELLSDRKVEEENKETTETETTSRDGENTSRNESTDAKKEDEKISKTESTLSKENVSIKYESSSKVTGKDIVEYAKKYIGYDYVYGGTSPKKGFDCSGFTYYVYKHFGYTISRSSTAQASNGKSVSKSDLKLGDLVFYKNTSLTRIGHVGIYIGDNKMIHASEPGVGVTITDIDSKAHNYPKRYVTSRRIIE